MMEWLYIAIAMVIAGGGTWLITKYNAHEYIKKFIGNFDKFNPAVTKLIRTVVDSFRPDPETGDVVLTNDEVNAIKAAFTELLALFGVSTPF